VRAGASPERAAEVCADVCSALIAAHARGLIHRDIKPGNVMLTPEGKVKVMDFGIARAVADSAATMTQTSAVLGTAQYLSPEQARGEPVDARSDVYSLGCVLYEILTGEPPFIGDSPVAVAYQHVREDPVPPSQRHAGISPELDAVVLKSLTKNPENRYQTAAEFAAAIKTAAAATRAADQTFVDTKSAAAADATVVARTVAAGASHAHPLPSPLGAHRLADQRRTGAPWSDHPCGRAACEPHTRIRPWRRSSRVQASSHAAGRAYVAKSGYKFDDFKPYLFRTDDFGVTWKSISSNLPNQPINVIVDMLALPKSDHDLFHQWYSAMMDGLGRTGARDAGRAAHDAVCAYVDPYLSERLACPGPDLLSKIAHSEADGQRLSDAEIKSFVSLMLVAGGETTDKAISNLWWNLLTHPEALAAVEGAFNAVMLQGDAIGGGLFIALACDLRLAAPHARFGVPVARTLGNFLAPLSLALLVAALGPGRARALVLTARLLDAAEAQAAGLVDQIHPAPELERRARELAASLAELAPLTLAATKEATRRMLAVLTPRDLDDLILSCYLSRDFHEGVRAFLEKRRPDWQGR
jgi:hypothetical protein